MSALVVDTPYEAFDLFRAALGDDAGLDDVTEIRFGGWLNPYVHLPEGHSEITPPFMEAFLDTQQSLLRLVAFIKYNVSDNRTLTQEDIDALQLRVRVEDGSSNFIPNLGEALNKLVELSVGKLTNKQIVGLIMGLGILTSGSVGFNTYLEHRKEVRVEQLHSDERKQALQAVTFANQQESELAREVIHAMQERGGAYGKAVTVAGDVNSSLLKAASSVPQVTISGQHLTRAEAKELRASARRTSTEVVVEQEMRVVEINTSDQAHTTVVVEEVAGGHQYSLSFRDRLIQERDTEKLYVSLRARSTVWLRLSIRQVGDEPRSVTILGVVNPPEPPALDVAEAP